MAKINWKRPKLLHQNRDRYSLKHEKEYLEQDAATRWLKKNKHGITGQEIMAAQTPKGGWTKAQLAKWGVPWPPPQGWKKSLITYGYPYEKGLK